MCDDCREFARAKGLEWLVIARNKIQGFLLSLHQEFHRAQRQRTEKRIREWHLLLGAGFSLWRAVFLIDGTEEPRSLQSASNHSESFLRGVMAKDPMYHEGMRRIQDARDTRGLADRPEQVTVCTVFDEEDRALIQRSPMFFIATADADGRPDCSYKNVGDIGVAQTRLVAALLRRGPSATEAAAQAA